MDARTSASRMLAAVWATALLIVAAGSARGGDQADPWVGLWAEGGAVAKDAPPPPIRLDGRLGFRAVMRTTDGGRRADSDQDLYPTLRGRIERPGSWAAEVDAMMAVDLDGTHDGPFYDVDETYRNPRPYLYRAFVEGQKLGPFTRVRIGRQTHDPGTEMLRFDGASLEAALARWVEARVFGGVPAHLYDTQARGDWLLGADLTLRPQSGTSLRIGYVHLEDGRRGPVERRDNRYDLSLTQRFGQVARVRLDAAIVDGRSTELRLRGLVRLAEYGLTARPGLLVRVGSWRELTTDLSYYDEVLIRYEDHVQADLSVTEMIGEHLSLDGATTLRWLRDNDSEGPFNHRFGRWTLGVSVYDLLAKGLTISVSGGGWHARTDDIYTWGGEVRYRRSRDLDLALGSSYELFHIDRFLIKERQRVRSFYARVRARPLESLELRLRGALERDDHELYLTLDLGVALLF